jgi:hypothetical protein
LPVARTLNDNWEGRRNIVDAGIDYYYRDVITSEPKVINMASEWDIDEVIWHCDGKAVD